MSRDSPGTCPGPGPGRGHTGRDACAAQRTVAPFRDLRAGIDRRARARSAVAAALYALSLPDRLRPDRDARRTRGRPDRARRAGDEERLLPLLLRLGRAGAPVARRAHRVLV